MTAYVRSLSPAFIDGDGDLAEIFCEDHGPFNDRDRISRDEQFDCPVHCGNIDCDTLLDVDLSNYGIDYIKEYLDIDPDSPVVQHWADHYSEYLA